MKIIILPLSILIFIICSCKDKQTTNPDNGLDKNWIEITDTTSMDILCLNWDIINDFYKFIIIDSVDYKNLDTLRVDGKLVPVCKDYIFPEIDFSKHSVLGCFTRTNTCVIINRHIYKNIPLKKYLYKIEIISYCLDVDFFACKNLMIIPKIPPDYEVSIEPTIRVDTSIHK
jgi:hypothetical protein